MAQQIMHLCQCQYLGSHIVDGQLFCASKDDVIYQAQLLSTDGKTALEVRNTIQQWILSRPTILIDSLSYQVDPNCSTSIKELGETSCNAATESQPTNQRSVVSTSIIVVSVIVMLVLLCIGLITISLCYLHKRKSKSLDLR